MIPRDTLIIPIDFKFDIFTDSSRLPPWKPIPGTSHVKLESISLIDCIFETLVAPTTNPTLSLLFKSEASLATS